MHSLFFLPILHTCSIPVLKLDVCIVLLLASLIPKTKSIILCLHSDVNASLDALHARTSVNPVIQFLLISDIECLRAEENNRLTVPIM